MAILSQWFSQKRSLANGISSAGSGAGGVILTWGTASIIRSTSLAWALRTTGLVTLVANITATVFVRDRNRNIRPNLLAFDDMLLSSIRGHPASAMGYYQHIWIHHFVLFPLRLCHFDPSFPQPSNRYC